MRYFSILAVSSLISLLGQQVVIASEVKTKDIVGQTPFLLAQNTDFWPQAQKVVQEQIYLINRIENAVSNSPDLHRLESVEGQLFLHQGTLQRFLYSQSRYPKFVCPPGGTTNSSVEEVNLTPDQTQVYCNLYDSLQQLNSLKAVIDKRLPRVADLAATNPIPTRTIERYNFRVPARSRSLPVPNLPPQQTLEIYSPVKPPIAAYIPPVQPAIAPSEQATNSLQTVKKYLAKAIATFPPSYSFIEPSETTQAIEVNTYTVYPRQAQLYADFLAQPNTGIAMLVPAEFYRPNPNQLRNRLASTVAERFPFLPLVSNPNGFTPRLAIQLENNNFQIAQSELDNSFIADLGDVELENVAQILRDKRQLSSPMLQLFLNYRPPTQLEALKINQRRFTTGKLGSFPVNHLGLTQVPAVLNHTYLLRLIQYQLPDAIAKGGVLSREASSPENQRYLQQILNAPSSDILVAFRPISRRRDGSYTVLWQLIGKFPDPQISEF